MKQKQMSTSNPYRSSTVRSLQAWLLQLTFHDLRECRFVMYCIITTCSVECYWHCSDETVHYKSDEIMNFCGFRCVTTSPITVFINFVFCIYIKCHNLCQTDWTFPFLILLRIISRVYCRFAFRNGASFSPDLVSIVDLESQFHGPHISN